MLQVSDFQVPFQMFRCSIINFPIFDWLVAIFCHVFLVWIMSACQDNISPRQCFRIIFSHQNDVFNGSPQIRLLSRQGGKTVELENKPKSKQDRALSCLFTLLLPGISQLVKTTTVNRTALLESSDIHHGLALLFLLLGI